MATLAEDRPVTVAQCSEKHEETRRSIGLVRWAFGVSIMLILAFMCVVGAAFSMSHDAKSGQAAHEAYHTARDASIDESLKEIKATLKDQNELMRNLHEHVNP